MQRINISGIAPGLLVALISFCAVRSAEAQHPAESTVNSLDRNYLYTRLELVDKDDLLRLADRVLLGIKDAHPSFCIGAYTFGGARDIWTSKKVALAVRGDLTFDSK